MNKNYFERFKKFKLKEWLTIIFMGLVSILGLYMSIGFSVKIAQGYTLFGDSSKRAEEVELKTTSSDIYVLVLYWILTLLVLALFIYTAFFKKIDDKKPVKKDIYKGKTILVDERKEEKNDK